MFSNAESHFAYQMANAPLRTFPFSHAYVEKAFPEDFYGVLQQHLPTDSQLAPIAEKRPVKGYRERFVMCFDDDSLALLDAARREFWQQFRDCFRRGMIGGLLLDKFGSEVQERFRNSDEFTFHDELLLINDRDGYALGPHTDSPRKVVSLLFICQRTWRTSSMAPRSTFPRTRGSAVRAARTIPTKASTSLRLCLSIQTQRSVSSKPTDRSTGSNRCPRVRSGYFSMTCTSRNFESRRRLLLRRRFRLVSE